jgi:hypothetical protein
VNASLITGLNEPYGIAVDGSDLFITNVGAGTISEYTAGGTLVNASLISGLNEPGGIAIIPTTIPEPSTLTLGHFLLRGSDFAGGNTPLDHSEIARPA